MIYGSLNLITTRQIDLPCDMFRINLFPLGEICIKKLRVFFSTIFCEDNINQIFLPFQYFLHDLCHLCHVLLSSWIPRLEQN